MTTSKFPHWRILVGLLLLILFIIFLFVRNDSGSKNIVKRSFIPSRESTSTTTQPETTSNTSPNPTTPLVLPTGPGSWGIMPIATDSNKHTLIEERDERIAGYDFHVSLYRNSAYECGAEGYQTYGVIEPKDSIGKEVPTLIYIRGGSVGHYAPDGKYVGGLSKLYEPNLEQTVENPLSFLMNKEYHFYHDLIEDGYRIMAVSYCDHDIYAGVGQKDPYNPNASARVDGFLALRSSVDHYIETYPTPYFFVHGTSAGASGVWLLGLDIWAQGEERPPLAGLIPDAFLNSPRMDIFFKNACLPEVYQGDKDWDILQERVGVLGTDPTYYMENAVNNTAWDIPLYIPYATGDDRCCGDKPLVEEADAGGFENNCDFQYDPIVSIINSKGSPLYQYYRLDVDKHVLLDGNKSPDTRDLHADVLSWIRAVETTY